MDTNRMLGAEELRCVGGGTSTGTIERGDPSLLAQIGGWLGLIGNGPTSIPAPTGSGLRG